MTVVLVEQSVNVALTAATKAFFMEKGAIRFHGLTAELLERPELLRSIFLEGAAASQEAGTEADTEAKERTAAVTESGADKCAVAGRCRVRPIPCGTSGILILVG